MALIFLPEGKESILCVKSPFPGSKPDFVRISLKESNMWYWFKQILTPPTFEDEETTRIAALLHTLLLVLFVVIGVVTPIVLVADPENVGLNLLIALPVMLVIVGLLVLLRYARVKMAGGLNRR